jgi:hypothetical protein
MRLVRKADKGSECRQASKFRRASICPEMAKDPGHKRPVCCNQRPADHARVRCGIRASNNAKSRHALRQFESDSPRSAAYRDDKVVAAPQMTTSASCEAHAAIIPAIKKLCLFRQSLF